MYFAQILEKKENGEPMEVEVAGNVVNLNECETKDDETIINKFK